MERFYSDGLGKLCTLDEEYFQSDSFRMKLKIIMSIELPSQQLVPQLCSAGHYLFFSWSAPFALPCFTAGNFQMPLTGFMCIPQWIISGSPFRNNLCSNNNTKVAPSTRKNPASPFLIISHLTAPTQVFSALRNDSINARGVWASFTHPADGGADTPVQNTGFAVSIHHKDS